MYVNKSVDRYFFRKPLPFKESEWLLARNGTKPILYEDMSKRMLSFWVFTIIIFCTVFIFIAMISNGSLESMYNQAKFDILKNDFQKKHKEVVENTNTYSEYLNSYSNIKVLKSTQV